MGNLQGAARDNNNFAARVKTGPTLPDSKQIVYDGTFNEHYMKASTTDKLLAPVTHCGVDRFGNLLVGVEVVSFLDGKPRDTTKPIDFVFCLDTSGSMGCSLSATCTLQKLEAAKKFASKLTSALEPGDTVALVTFTTTPLILLRPTKQSDNASEKIEDLMSQLQAGGGTAVGPGLAAALNIARENLKLRKESGEGNNVQARVVMLTDMSSGEVHQAHAEMQRIMLEAAKEEVFVSYVGLGDDFDQELTEKITTATGSNYFSIQSEEDFDKRIVREIASCFFPLVSEMQLLLTTKQFTIGGVYGAGKNITTERADTEGYTNSRKPLYGEKVQAFADSVEHIMPEELISEVIDRQKDEKPVVILNEYSVFPAPIGDRPGYLYGGWIIIALKPNEDKGKAAGAIRIELQYTKFDGIKEKVQALVDLSEAEAVQERGEKDWASSEGMEKVMVLKQYVDGVKELLAEESAGNKPRAFPEDYLSWLEERVEKYELKKEWGLVVEMGEKLKSIRKSQDQALEQVS